MKFIKRYTIFYGSGEWVKVITPSTDSKEFHDGSKKGQKRINGYIDIF